MRILFSEPELPPELRAQVDRFKINYPELVLHHLYSYSGFEECSYRAFITHLLQTYDFDHFGICTDEQVADILEECSKIVGRVMAVLDVWLLNHAFRDLLRSTKFKLGNAIPKGYILLESI